MTAKSAKTDVAPENSGTQLQLASQTFVPGQPPSHPLPAKHAPKATEELSRMRTNMVKTKAPLFILTILYRFLIYKVFVFLFYYSQIVKN